MRLLVGALILAGSFQAQAWNRFSRYIPAHVGEHVGAISLNVNSSEAGYNCDIGLRQTKAENITVKPGVVEFLNFRASPDDDVLVRVNVSKTPEYRQLQALTDQIVVSNISEDQTGSYDGFIAYSLSTADETTLAYEASFFLKMGDGPKSFQNVGGGPKNQLAIQLVNRICNSARLVFNAKYPNVKVASLGADANKAAGAISDAKAPGLMKGLWLRVRSTLSK